MGVFKGAGGDYSSAVVGEYTEAEWRLGSSHADPFNPAFCTMVVKDPRDCSLNSHGRIDRSGRDLLEQMSYLMELS